MEGYCKTIKVGKSQLFLSTSVRVINELEDLLTKNGKTSSTFGKKSYLCHEVPLTTAAINLKIRY